MNIEIKFSKRPEPSAGDSTPATKANRVPLRGLGAAVVGLSAMGLFAGSHIGRAESPSPTGSALATPDAKPSSSPSTSPDASHAPQGIKNIEVKQLTTFDVLPGDIIPGDVSMSDTKDGPLLPLFDTDTHKASDVTDNTKTAMFVVVQAPGVVHAVYGNITVIRGMTPEQQAQWIANETVSKKRAGFDRLDPVVWKGYSNTTDEAGFKADGSAGASSSTTSPDSGVGGTSKEAQLAAIIKIFEKGNIDPTSDDGKTLIKMIMDCLCSTTPTETPKPAASPSPKSTPSAVCVPMTDHVMQSGESFPVSGQRFIVEGDVQIDGKKYYDSSDKTGAIDLVLDGGNHTVTAPWGADVQVFNSCAPAEAVTSTYNDDVVKLQGTGRSLDSSSLKQEAK